MTNADKIVVAEMETLEELRELNGVFTRMAER